MFSSNTGMISIDFSYWGFFLVFISIIWMVTSTAMSNNISVIQEMLIRIIEMMIVIHRVVIVSIFAWIGIPFPS